MIVHPAAREQPDACTIERGGGIGCRERRGDARPQMGWPGGGRGGGSGGARLNPRQITGALGKQARAEDVLSFCRDHLHELNHIHVNAALGKLAKLRSLPRHLTTDQTFVELVRFARRLAESGQYPAREMSNTAFAVAKMHQIGVIRANQGEMTDLVTALERRAEEVARDMKPQEMANLMWAYATLGRAPGAPTWEALERRAGEVARDMVPQNVANLMWAHATLGRADRKSVG